MYGKRLALAALAAALLVAALGATSSSAAQSERSPGRGYAGLKDFEPVWLRLDPSRGFISALEIPWGVDPARCTRRIWHRSTLFAGSVYSGAIHLTADGTFRKTVVDRYSDAGSRYVERQTVAGRIDGHVARGSISGRLRIRRPSGQVVRCTFGPQRWRADD
jgi:hypothetical protein